MISIEQHDLIYSPCLPKTDVPSRKLMFPCTGFQVFMQDHQKIYVPFKIIVLCSCGNIQLCAHCTKMINKGCKVLMYVNKKKNKDHLIPQIFVQKKIWQLFYGEIQPLTMVLNPIINRSYFNRDQFQQMKRHTYLGLSVNPMAKISMKIVSKLILLLKFIMTTNAQTFPVFPVNLLKSQFSG